jgi:hypothetical protein
VNQNFTRPLQKRPKFDPKGYYIVEHEKQTPMMQGLAKRITLLNV